MRHCVLCIIIIIMSSSSSSRNSRCICVQVFLHTCCKMRCAHRADVGAEVRLVETRVPPPSSHLATVIEMTELPVVL